MAVIRLAVLPRAHADVTRVDLEPEQEGYEERLVEYLSTIVADPVVREALAVSSGSLADTIAKVTDGRPVERAKLERGVFAATRYLLRMTGRPTPFGLLAGVQRLEFGDAARVRVGDRHHKSVRPDNAWLTAALTHVRHDPAVRDRCRVVVNNLCAVRGERLVLPYVRYRPEQPDTDDDAGRQVSIRCTPVVQTVLRAARRPIPYPDLRAEILQAFPGATTEHADRMLGELIDREFLLTDLLARRDLPDRLEAVNELLSDVDGPVPQTFRRIGRMLADYQNEPLGAGLKSWQAAVSAMRGLSGLNATGDRSPVQVDLRVDAEIRLPRQVAEELTAVGEALWRMAPPDTSTPELTEYHQAFLERYGPDAVLPLLTVLDSHLGLGPPAGYRVPRGERGAPAPPDNPYPVARERLVADRMLEVIRSGRDELVLDEEMVDRLAHDESVPPPQSFDLCAELHASSLEAVRRGDFRLLVSTGAGSVAAGAMAGRFARLLDIDEALAAVMGERTGTDPDSGPLLAQLYFQPRHARFDNVTLVPKLLTHSVEVGTFADPDAGDVVDVRDLMLGADEHRLYLMLPDGREVVVVTPHMLQLRTSAPNVARFLTAVMMSGIRLWIPWSWGRLEALPYLPRVRYRRTVLTPGRWRAPPELGDRKLSWPRWQHGLRAWRETNRVPDLVRVSVFDQHVELDLTVPLHQQLLRNQLQRTHSVLLREVGPRDEAWLDGHANEIVLPLVAGRPWPPVAKSRVHEVVQVQHRPGGDWLFAKVYAVREMQDSLLHREIAALAAELPSFVDRWFFIRYLDPDAHIRLRFHGPAARLAGEFLAVLRDWADRCREAGSIRAIVLDTYEPEVWRYGGPAAIDDAERVFHADSVAVLAQLAERARGGLTMPIEVLAAINHVQLLASLGDWDWMRWVLDRFPIELQKRIRGYREQALTLVDPRLRWARLRDDPAWETLPAVWAERARAAAAYGRRITLGEPESSAVDSLLHLHSNRLIGLDRDAERVSYGILRAAVRNHLGQLRKAP
ncbi:MAG TPA: lantibiotic dehydratase [Candidatus Limnocylindrales bacterium]|nr:lantibiotic dehydratase [Candidatus Limnocylindrales bacterium]